MCVPIAGQQSEEFLEPNIRSGQLRQAFGALSSALNSENYNSVVANIGQGLDPNHGKFFCFLVSCIIVI